MRTEEMAEWLYVETTKAIPELISNVATQDEMEARSIAARNHAKVCFLLAASFEVIAAEIDEMAEVEAMDALSASDFEYGH